MYVCVVSLIENFFYGKPPCEFIPSLYGHCASIIFPTIGGVLCSQCWWHFVFAPCLFSLLKRLNLHLDHAFLNMGLLYHHTTSRELPNQVAGLYDPIGLTTPANQKGAILVPRGETQEQ